MTEHQIEMLKLDIKKDVLHQIAVLAKLLRVERDKCLWEFAHQLNIEIKAALYDLPNRHSNSKGFKQG